MLVEYIRRLFHIASGEVLEGLCHLRRPFLDLPPLIEQGVGAEYNRGIRLRRSSKGAECTDTQ